MTKLVERWNFRLKAMVARFPARAPGALACRFARQRSGSVAVEFALIGLVSLELITEAMQAGLYFYTSAALERATVAASRAIMTGSVANQNLSSDQFRSAIVCPNLTSISLSCSKVVTNIQTVAQAVAPGGFYSFINSAQTGLVPPSAMDNTKTNFCTGSTGSYIYVQIFYAMPVLSPIWRAYATIWNGTASYFVQSTAVFKNEPFQATATSTC